MLAELAYLFQHRLNWLSCVPSCYATYLTPAVNIRPYLLVVSPCPVYGTGGQ